MVNTNINSMNALQILIDINSNNIANINTKNFKATNANVTDKFEVTINTSNNGTNLTKELTEQIIIENSFKAQTVSIKTQNEMTKILLDIKV